MYYYSLLKVDQLSEGENVEICGVSYIKHNGILRQLARYSKNQHQTQNTFKFKWSKHDSYQSDPFKEATIEWYLTKYFNGNKDLRRKFFFKDIKVLDAGCEPPLHFESHT